MTGLAGAGPLFWPPVHSSHPPLRVVSPRGRPLPDQEGGGDQEGHLVRREASAQGLGGSPDGEVAAEKQPEDTVSWAASEQKQPSVLLQAVLCGCHMVPRGYTLQGSFGGCV